ncbi:MAG: hypothetical protein H0T73_14480 [Ardenticatenales bacterium]|nr:hypothetical protein [Ardenticatenales bacterium]
MHHYLVQKINRLSVVARVQEILEGFAFHCQTLLQEEEGLAQGEGATLDGVGVVGPLDFELGLDGLPEVPDLFTLLEASNAGCELLDPPQQRLKPWPLDDGVEPYVVPWVCNGQGTSPQ